MLDFGELTEAEATAYRDAYAAACPVRRRWLEAEVAAAGDPAALVDGSDQLEALWSWYSTWFDEVGPFGLTLRTPRPPDDPQPGSRPPWYAAEPSPHMSDGALWLIDLIGVHVAMLVIDAVPDTQWAVYSYRGPNPKRGVDINYRRTMMSLAGGTALVPPPADAIYGITIGRILHGGSWDRYGGLPGLYAHWLAKSSGA